MEIKQDCEGFVPIELIENLKKNPDFIVQEHCDDTIYSLMIFYKDNFIFQRGREKTRSCNSWKNDRMRYVAELEAELTKLGISY